MEKTGFSGYLYDFSVDYDAIAVYERIDIHNCLMKKMALCNKIFGFILSYFFLQD